MSWFEDNVRSPNHASNLGEEWLIRSDLSDPAARQ